MFTRHNTALGRNYRQDKPALGRNYRQDKPALLARAPAVMAAACALYGLTPDAILVEDRRRDIVRMRFIVVYALRLLGLYPADISRLMNRNHATITHALVRAEQDPEVVRLARVVMEPSVAQAWDSRQSTLGAAGRVAVRRYLVALTDDRQLDASALHGLSTLARDARTRRVAVRALVAAGMGRHVWRIREHARQAGLRWIDG